MKPYTPYIPQNLSELWDQIGSMILNAPNFVDETGYIPERSIDTEFFALNASLALLRPKFGEERYAAMIALSDMMRAHFDADPEDNNGETDKGRGCLFAMEDIIRDTRKRR